MKQSLLFLPDISGFTHFVQNTEVAHSQHVIAELLDILANANTLDMELAEVEGDALFFYKEEIPSQEKILAQVETMFSAFNSHLKLLEKNRICPCNACSTAPNLELKIVAHSGELQFINVQGKRKPFGTMVIEVHRLMKNSVDSNNYVLISKPLSDELKMLDNYCSKLYQFSKGSDSYDGKVIDYIFSEIDNNNLILSPFPSSKTVKFDEKPSIYQTYTFDVSANVLLEYITNYSYRHYWVNGVDKFIYNENEVTRLDSPHVCVINGQHLDFVVVVKEGQPKQLIYGELTTSPGMVDEMYQFFILTPVSENKCQVEVEVYFKAKSIFKKLMIALIVKSKISKSTMKNMEMLQKLAQVGVNK